MADIMLRPDLKTAGGEVCDIMYNGEFVGTLTLVYRESDRLKGAIHLEKQSITTVNKQAVYDYAQSYIQDAIDALGIIECEVTVSYSDYDFVIATDHAIAPTTFEEDFISNVDLLHDDELDYSWLREDISLQDEDTYLPVATEPLNMVEELKQQHGYELVIVSETRSSVEYHVYDKESELIAEASLHIYGSEVIGDISWKFDPFDEEMDIVTELIVADFNEEQTDSFVFHMIYNGETVDTVELTHIDMLDLMDDIQSESDMWIPRRDDYDIVLVRDDPDTLSYEIYQQTHGGLPIGTATVDISSRQVTGFIDFRELGDSDDRELIATLLLEELDKEKEYETFNVSMLYRNKLIDEIMFETEHYH
ncbi:hypothetical protein A8709_29520 [Paenibacillus pectinilyticus]|uniref:Uncharacterized protein n=1 Tax=Paenibacillus pectinilyticus TaxID=512399 RepID=A0A1C0ZV77_9BACL|nr:hypothetical protein [Paenibacillus pectinilyticus]OCT11999.1 hypothetical protein A8709_29520 [Paenibacillus pectinilyticus]